MTAQPGGACGALHCQGCCGVDNRTGVKPCPGLPESPAPVDVPLVQHAALLEGEAVNDKEREAIAEAVSPMFHAFNAGDSRRDEVMRLVERIRRGEFAPPEPKRAEAVAWGCRACGWIVQTKDADRSWAIVKHGEFCCWSHDSDGVRLLTWAYASPAVDGLLEEAAEHCETAAVYVGDSACGECGHQSCQRRRDEQKAALDCAARLRAMLVPR